MILLDHLGELAAVGAAVCWTVCSIAFTRAGKEVGSLCVNLIRLLMAGLLMGFLCLFVYGQFLPVTSGRAWRVLGMSGVIGFFIGDLCLFKAFLLIGPRLGLLIMSLWPPIAALLAWWWHDEWLSAWQWCGMTVVLAGVSTVVMERPHRDDEKPARHYAAGMLLGLVAAVGQAAGYVISAEGMRLMDPDMDNRIQVCLQATQMRLLAATVCFVVVFTLTRRWPAFVAAIRHRRAMMLLGVGAVTGPFLGVALSLLALSYIQAGVASTIMAIAPILILPYAILVDKERVNRFTILGAFVAVLGLAILSLF